MNAPDQDPNATLKRPTQGGDATMRGVQPGSQAPASAGPQREAAAAMALSATLHDLSGDPLLRNAPRTAFRGQNVPTLGGIPLLAKLGQGGMGAVYYGARLLLQQEVAVKVLPMQLAEQHPEMVERFLREARIAARVESPHLVRVSDVSEQAGLFYLVMEFVRGVSAGGLLKEQRASGTQLDEATALDICTGAAEGLATAHAKGIVHRDIKPDNILVPRGDDGTLQFGAAKLADLGLARDSSLGQTLTGAQDTMGTPGFMAPEQAMSAKTAGKPADVFSMGATLYALLAGQSPFKGDSTTESILKTIQQPHKPIREVRPDVSAVTAELLDRCLAKEPGQRYVDGSALRDALKVCRQSLAAGGSPPQAAIEQLTQLQRAPEVGLAKPAPSSFRAEAGARQRRGKVWAAVAAFVIAVAGAGLWLWQSGLLSRPAVTLGIAYGTEKEAWLQWAAAEFAKTPEGRGIAIELLQMGSLEGAKALLAGDQRINVWSPASSLYESSFVKEWQAKYNKPPIARQEDLVLTPLVFLAWQDRYEAFSKKYQGMTFLTLAQAQQEPGGWAAIAQKPEWGKVFYGQTDPVETNGGLAALVLMAYDFSKKDKTLTVADVTSSDFQTWVQGVAGAGTVAKDNESIMREMTVKGPSSYEIVCIYESVAIQYLKGAEGRWGAVHVEYPACNIWNDNPYCIIDAPWSSPEQRVAAEAFLKFLLAEATQKQALHFGLRPANPDVPMKFPESPFEVYTKSGLKLDVPLVCENPNADVITALLDTWKKARAAK